MSQLQQRIAQFRKMATDDPDNELGHFRLGQLLMEAGQFDEATTSFERTLEIEPNFSKAYQLLATCLTQVGRADEAVRVLTEGYEVADGRGDKMPRDEMGRMLVQLGQPAPQPKGAAPAVADDGPATGFQCRRPLCQSGSRARPLDKPPTPDALGERIRAEVCAQCWDGWYKDYSIKVINELRLDLSSEYGQAEYDKHLRDYLGFEEPEAP
jgi:tetratricopeptide (TPR) repeat protein